MHRSLMAGLSVVVLIVIFSLPLNPLARGGEGPAKQLTKIGSLSCNVASGWGFVFGSSRKLRCTYTPADKTKSSERYTGSISRFGTDIGYLQSGVFLWSVFAPEMKVTSKPGLLAGRYKGQTASATVVEGAAMKNAMVGGTDGLIELQPVSIEGNRGLNIAAGVAMVDLMFSSSGSAGE